MIRIFSSRASSLGLIAMGLLFILGMTQGKEAVPTVALAIAGIPSAVAAAHAAEKRGKKNDVSN